MFTIRESIEKIRAVASSWLTDQTTDGSTAMGEVSATLLNTNFEEVQYVNVRQPSDDELLAEIDKLATAAKSGNVYEGITDPDVLVRLESRINAAEHPPGTWAENRQRMGSICTKTNTALSPLAIENGWASFSFKRDAYLAVEAVNALPELIARVRSSEAGERAADAEVERLQGLLDAAKSLGTAACDQVIATCNEQTPALRDVAAERLRQVSVEGYKPERDDCYTSGEMAQAAGAYAIYSTFERDGSSLSMAAANLFPWDMVHWKAVDHRRNLVKAGAMILAEIERLDRAEEAKKPANWDRTKPEWSSHSWPQIFQNSSGNWFGVRAGWDLKAHISSGWKGDEVSLLSDDGNFLKYGEPSSDWRDSLEQRPVAELYTAADEARMDVVGQNGPTGEHYEALPMGLTWEQAPEWATALVEADADNTSIPDRVLIWVPAINQSVDGELAIESMGRKAGKRQHVTMDHPASVWTVVATRPAPAGDGWIEWTGELCPVDDLDAMVWVRLEGVSEVRPGIARNWDWRTEPAMGRSRIVAYTLKDPAKAARP